MPKLNLSIRIAAGSICALSLLHLVFWVYVAVASRTADLDASPYTLFFPVALAFSLLGVIGVLVGVGIFRARAWARVAALVLAALVAIFCVFGLFALFFLAGAAKALGLEIHSENTGYLVAVGSLYFAVLGIALWWIYLFSRSSVAAQFSLSCRAVPDGTPAKATCPPPIALLAWLMIASSLLSALSWPLILGKIPAMLFTHIFSSTTSKWIWIANIALFLACGVGLLRLRRWSYSGAIALHTFWLVSVFVTQLSAGYDAYMRRCIETLSLGEAYPVLSRIHVSPWASAVTTAIPTALLIVGLFHYRSSFLRAVNDSRHLLS